MTLFIVSADEELDYDDDFNRWSSFCCVQYVIWYFHCERWKVKQSDQIEFSYRNVDIFFLTWDIENNEILKHWLIL